jgi:glycerophosphoryl diester phosphodiesterase
MPPQRARVKIRPARAGPSITFGLQAQTGSIAVIARRGERPRHPENTMPAFEEAVRVGAGYFELDVRATSGGKLVLMHDATADRTTHGHGEVAKTPFDEIRALDADNKTDSFPGVKVPPSTKRRTTHAAKSTSIST